MVKAVLQVCFTLVFIVPGSFHFFGRFLFVFGYNILEPVELPFYYKSYLLAFVFGVGMSHTG